MLVLITVTGDGDAVGCVLLALAMVGCSCTLKLSFEQQFIKQHSETARVQNGNLCGFGRLMVLDRF